MNLSWNVTGNGGQAWGGPLREINGKFSSCAKRRPVLTIWVRGGLASLASGILGRKISFFLKDQEFLEFHSGQENWVQCLTSVYVVPELWKMRKCEKM